MPLWLGFWRPDPRPDPRPHWVSSSWPESYSGGGGGTGLGGEVGGWPVATFFFLAGAEHGTTDSSLALLLTGSPSSPPLAISFLAATLLAMEVRCTRNCWSISLPVILI